MRRRDPALMAPLWSVAAAAQTERPPVVIALTEGGLLYSITVCGAGRLQGAHSQSVKYRTFLVLWALFSLYPPFSFLFFFSPGCGRQNLRDFHHV